MNGKELLLAALRGEKTQRPAWVPFVGCHGGKLIGLPARQYLTQADDLVRGLLKAKELYQPDGLPVMFDLQVEAEILGCQLKWADEVPPSVCSHPLAEGKSVSDLPPLDAGKGRFPVIVEAMRRLKEEIGGDTALYGLVCGPFTLALHLLGNDIFLDMYDDEEAVQAVLAYCAEVAIQSAGIYLDNGADVIGVVDPMTSQISPAHFEQFVAGPVNRVFDYVRSREALASIFVCGDVTRNLEVMCATRANNISVDEQIDMARLRKLAAAQGKSFGGNIKLTGVLLLGDPDDARLETLSILDQCGDTGFVLAPGCDLPYAVPEANLQAVAEMVHDDYKRETARATLKARKADDFSDIELPDYTNGKELIIDVITLDSASCAPCQYMMDAAVRASAESGVTTRVVEHKIKDRAGIGVMTKLGVTNLPTICLGGKPAFVSLIPDQKTLIEAIRAAAP